LHYKVQDPPAGYTTWEAFLKESDIPEEFSAVVDPEGKGPRIFLQRVPESKSVKNRMHLDLNVTRDLSIEASSAEKRQALDVEIERLQALGARELYRCDLYGEYWITMADPEGNEFCIQ
jgi:hypothetical protein